MVDVVLFAILFALGFVLTQPAQAPAVNRDTVRSQIVEEGP